ncbi:branched-chain-amino-acid aminotransferase [Clostridium acetireducens DSM 10703]|jgi:branched-chain amino acid aminotransferase|uniref:Branched-chain-amino-acid aminotransferase n=1 Tax=Clostridium acetireducens DSM 10703 TaxID=1121290 RepID=A0A1E8EZF3_9CLOT|nr:aminotransferase class IV [Clostridium acetireducens]OFI06524.1 branched-chain-amino-acid aminotransferase [Clostridium acetireducens DSM 10703]
MYECFRDYFIENGEVREKEQFNMDILKKGKALYEVLRVIDGAPLFLKEHIQRLKNSADIVNLKLWVSEKQIEEQIFNLIKINNVKDGNVKIVFNYIKQVEKFSKNNYAIYFLKHNYPEKQQYEKGVPTILYHGERENPNAKVINIDFRAAVNEEIKKCNVYEAILVDRQGYITEGSRSNIFMIEGKNVITSPVEAVLPGITREFIIRVCKSLGYTVKEMKFHYNDIKKLQGLFISGTSPKVLPINKVDNMEFKSAENPVIKSIMAGFDKAIQEDIKKYN